MIRCCNHSDFEVIWAIINDGAHAYKGVIPAETVEWSLHDQGRTSTSN